MSRLFSLKQTETRKSLAKNAVKTPFPTKALSISELPTLPKDTATKGHVLALESPSGTHSISLAELKSYLLEELLGTIQAFGSYHVPSNYLVCQGQWVSIVDYPKLFEKIGTQFGDNSSNPSQFLIPDLRGFFIRGASDSVPLGTAQDDMMRRLTGNFRGSYGGTPNGSFILNGGALEHYGGGSHGLKQEFFFDSARGVEGQEGMYSANVGYETRPRNVSFVLAMRAK